MNCCLSRQCYPWLPAANWLSHFCGSGGACAACAGIWTALYADPHKSRAFLSGERSPGCSEVRLITNSWLVHIAV